MILSKVRLLKIIKFPSKNWRQSKTCLQFNFYKDHLHVGDIFYIIGFMFVDFDK